MVKLLVEYGADVNTYSNDFGSPLDRAVSRAENFDVINYLFSAGARITTGPTVSTLDVCCSRFDRFAADIAELIIEKGCDVNQRAENGSYPIINASALGDSELLEVLLKNGAKPNVGPPKINGTHFITTPLITAIRASNMSKINLLIKYGADVNFPLIDDGKIIDTPLRAAKRNGNKEILRILKNNGAR